MKSEPSFSKFNYGLRPAKQVERRLIAEGCRKLSTVGLSVDEYVYVGLGSPYFADFVLFFRLLGIGRMICIEREPIPRRMRFNVPFPFVELKMMTAAEAIPSLPRRRRLLVWLDYDDPLCEEMLDDIAGVVRVAATGSVVLVTVNADRGSVPNDRERTRALVERLEAAIGRYGPIDENAVTGAELPKTIAKGLLAHLAEEVSKRIGLSFEQLFGYRYRDGAAMVTVGGVLADEGMRRRLKQRGFPRKPFADPTGDLIAIAVPPLTERERAWLSQRVRNSAKSAAARLDLDEDVVSAFRTFRRYYPAYAELLV